MRPPHSVQLSRLLGLISVEAPKIWRVSFGFPQRQRRRSEEELALPTLFPHEAPHIPKGLTPLFIFEQPETQTNIWRRYELFLEELKLRFFHGVCDVGQLEADVLFRITETKAATLRARLAILIATKGGWR